jgi:glucosamine-6-phosphate deaminase
MHEHFFDHINIRPENIHLPSGTAEDMAAEGRRYEDMIARAGGIDLQVLGIGRNAHIGFNEPDVKFEATTHKVALDDETIKANARFFDREEDVPRYAISMGIKTIMLARRVILLASGAAKAEAVRKTLCGSVTPKAPASILQLHQDVTIILDKEAAALLPKEIYGVRIDNYS